VFSVNVIITSENFSLVFLLRQRGRQFAVPPKVLSCANLYGELT